MLMTKYAMKHHRHKLKFHVLQQFTFAVNVMSMGRIKRDKITALLEFL